MFEDKISSNESEGAFNEFIDEQLENVLDGILQDGSFENIADSGSDIIVEVDQIEPPRFIHDSESGTGGGKGNQGPGKGSEKLRFSLPFEKFMELIAKKLGLPRLHKKGEGKIKEVSLEYKTFGQRGVILDKKRTFKRALKTSVASGHYAPHLSKYDVQIHRRDRRFKIPEPIEKPCYKAVVFYMGDVSYSTHGMRLKLEKQLVHFIKNWLDYNYQPKNVEHRFFVHDYKAHEVNQEDFYNVTNAGGTFAASAFEIVSQIALSEYDPISTNYYAFYFGDGEIFDDDSKEVLKLLEDPFKTWFNRVGVVEVLPSRISSLNKIAGAKFSKDPVLKFTNIQQKEQMLSVIQTLFGENYAPH